MYLYMCKCGSCDKKSELELTQKGSKSTAAETYGEGLARLIVSAVLKLCWCRDLPPSRLRP
jgi:hypothetical protein